MSAEKIYNQPKIAGIAQEPQDLTIINSWLVILNTLYAILAKLNNKEYQALKKNVEVAAKTFDTCQSAFLNDADKLSISNDEFIKSCDAIDKIIKELFNHPQIIVAFKYTIAKVEYHRPVDQFGGVDSFTRAEKSPADKDLQETQTIQDSITVFIKLYQNFLCDTKKYMDITLKKLSEIPGQDKETTKQMNALIAALDWHPEKFSKTKFNRWSLMEDIKKVYDLQKYCERFLENTTSTETKQYLKSIIMKCESEIFLLDRLYEMRKKEASFLELPLAGKVFRITKRLLQIGAVVGFVLLFIPGLQVPATVLLLAPLFVLPILKLAKWTVRRFYYHRPITREQKARVIKNVISIVISAIIAAVLTVISVLQQIPIALKAIAQISMVLLNCVMSMQTVTKIVHEFIRDTIPVFHEISLAVSAVPKKIKSFTTQLKKMFSIFKANPEQIKNPEVEKVIKPAPLKKQMETLLEKNDYKDTEELKLPFSHS